MKKTGLLVVLLFVLNGVFAQNRRNTLEVRINYMEEIFAKYQHRDRAPDKCLSLSFINNSDQDIFVPYIYPRLLNDNKKFISKYKKESGQYKSIDTPKSGHVNIVGVDFGGINWRHKLAKDKFNLYIIEHASNKAEFDKLLDPFESAPLFLKAHEEKEFALNLTMDFETDPGTYKIAFEPKLKMPAKDDYPTFIMTYKKFFPTEIKANVVYLHFEVLPKDRD
jgi:hypothetical protein